MPSPRRPPAQDGTFLAAVAAVGLLLAWLATTPRALGFINWDQGHYIGRFVNGTLGWSHEPWNAHFAIGYIYSLACSLVLPLGGTPIDGFRLANAICFGAAAALFFDLSWRLSRDRFFAMGLLAVWMTCWVN